MSNENETVADICREMKTYKNAEAFVECDDGSLDFVSVTDDLPIRIAVAHKREMERLAVPTPEQWTEIARQGCELADTKRENERLREALKPILECDESSMVCFKDAVHAAKRIALKGGTK